MSCISFWPRLPFRPASLLLLLFCPGLLRAQVSDAVTLRERELLDRIQRLEQRLDQLEGHIRTTPAVSVPVVPVSAAQAAPAGTGASMSATPAPLALPEAFRDTTLNVNLDGYYGYNFNRPVGRVNLLRAYDTQSNSFTLNQAGLILEKAPNLDAGRRYGLRLDLMFGSATETLQGGAQNEPRPQTYRNLFQAYGSYVLPVGKGLQVDFGKFASALGLEGNYTKDQLTYSRAYWFNFLPFYHFGFRNTYTANDKLSVQYWLVNGANQSEDFNGFKSQALLLNVKPHSSLSWNINYYVGQEQRDLAPALNPGIPSLPTQPGLSVTPIETAPRGRFHVFDTYATWTPNKMWLFAGEYDVVVNRADQQGPPTRVTGGAAYARYQFTPNFSLANRFVLLKDKGGLFSGASQILKDATVAATYQFTDGFQAKLEYRRDFSNVPFFLTHQAGLLKQEQSTAQLGLLWWFGGKQGGW